MGIPAQAGVVPAGEPHTGKGTAPMPGCGARRISKGRCPACRRAGASWSRSGWTLPGVNTGESSAPRVTTGGCTHPPGVQSLYPVHRARGAAPPTAARISGEQAWRYDHSRGSHHQQPGRPAARRHHL